MRVVGVLLLRPDAPGLEGYTFFGFYDPATNSFTRRPLPPQGVFPRQAAAFNGKLYFLDGEGRCTSTIPTPAHGRPVRAATNRELIEVTTAVVAGKWYVVG